MRLYDVAGFTRKWLCSVRDDQLPDGRIANFSPDGHRIKGHPDVLFARMTGSSGWGDAITLVPWLLYETYGDREALAENWDAMVRWVEWALATARTSRHPSRVERSAEPLPHENSSGTAHSTGVNGSSRRRARGRLAHRPGAGRPSGWFTADKGEVGTAYLARSTATLAATARSSGTTRTRPATRNWRTG